MKNVISLLRLSFLMTLFGFVAGLGDMAVSNTIGSNVFDILVGLGVPWALQTMCVDYGSVVRSLFTSSQMLSILCFGDVLSGSERQD